MNEEIDASRPILLAYLFIVKQQYVMNMLAQLINQSNRTFAHPILYCRRSAKMRAP